MNEKDTRKVKVFSTKLSAEDQERALYIMRCFGIKTVSALIRELIRGTYEYLEITEKGKENA